VEEWRRSAASRGACLCCWMLSAVALSAVAIGPLRSINQVDRDVERRGQYSRLARRRYKLSHRGQGQIKII